MGRFADRELIIPATNPNRPGIKLVAGKPEWITIHDTANTAPGANAAMHADFVNSGQGGKEQVSFHFVVDDHESIQLLPTDEVGWHAGDGAHGVGNTRSVAIETCVNADGDWNATLSNLVALVRRLMAAFGIDADHIVQHNHWSGKDCPHTIRAHGEWDALKARFAGSEGVKLNGHSVSGGFGELFARYGQAVCGLPLSEEVHENGKTVQYFENVVMEWTADGGARLGAVGRRWLEVVGTGHWTS